MGITTAGRALDRLAPLATTGIGSLPFTAPEEAARHAARAYDVAFCPQLPRLDGDPRRAVLGADPGRCGWSPGRDRERPTAWTAWVAELAARPPGGRLVKLQLTGPVTLARALERAAGRTGRRHETLDLAHDIARWLGAAARAQVLALHELGLDVLVLVDEPGLDAAGLGPADAAVWDALRATSPWGLHVCGPVPWAVVDAAQPDVLSFDAGRPGEAARGRAVLARLVRRGGRIAWGVLDPLDPGDAAGAAARIAACLGSLAGADAGLATVARHSLVTPACGTGGVTPARERLVAATLDAAAGAARAAVVAHEEAAARELAS